MMKPIRILTFLLKKRKGSDLSLEGYLLSKNFVIHDVKDKGKTIIYVRNMETVMVRNNRVVDGLKLGFVIYDINGVVLINIKFIPNSITLFDVMMKQAVINNDLINIK